MAPRSFLLCVCFTIGLLTRWSLVVNGLDIGVSFLVEPRDVVVARNKPFLLECAASSALGPVSIAWTHNGQPLPLADGAGAGVGGRLTLLVNGSLHFKKVVTKRLAANDGPDPGEYRCVATATGSHVALVSRPAQLRVAVISHNFTEFPSDQIVEEGNTVRFACQIDAVPTVVVTWEKNQIPLTLNSRYILLDSGILLISAVELQDVGSYRCVASNPLSNTQRTSPEGQLRVVARSSPSPPAAFLATPSSPRRVIVGDNLTLECTASGWPPPKLTWTHDGQAVDLSGIRAAPGVSLLRLVNVQPADGGNYSCTIGGSDQAMTVNVAVLVPPTVVKGPLSQVYPTAKTVRFECEVDGVPMPEVTWVKDGVPLKINGRIKQRPTELVLSNTVTDDSGLYQCVASSVAGETWVAGRLLVNASQYRPEPPHSLSCVAKSANQIEVTWEWGEPKQLASHIQAYTVHVLPTAGGEEMQHVSIHKSFLVEKLEPYTNYTFYARSYNDRAASDQSPRVICQTGEGVPQAAVTLSLEAVSPTTLLVQWRPLSNEQARGVVTEYKIQWRRKGSFSTYVHEVRGNVHEYSISGLHPGKKYDVRVIASTSQGFPDQQPQDQLAWQAHEMPTYDQQDPLPIPTVHLTVVNFTSIDVTWDMPAGGQHVLAGYKLYYRKQNSQAVGPVVLGANVTQYLLTGLDADEWYEIHVAGFDEDGEGNRGVKSIHTLPITGTTSVTQPHLDHLEPPTSVEADPTAPTVINLTWNPPAHPENISYYTICYSPVANSEMVSYVSSTGNRVEIGNLKPYTLYEFKVRSNDHNRQHGPYSQTIECHTQEDVPGVVQDVQWKALNSTAARVTWKAPTKANGVVGAYLVAFSSDTSLPADQWHSRRVPAPKTSTDLFEITPNVRYFLFVRAETKAGLGPATGVLTLLIIPAVNKASPAPPYAPQGSNTDQHLGIILGVVIGVGCMLMCVLIIVWRKRCARSAVPDPAGGVVNGNGCCRDRRLAGAGRDMHELELLSDTGAQIVPMHIPPSNHAHCDTKGGVGSYPNGQTNGLTNGRIPNGHSVRDRSSVHITENPQFSRPALAATAASGNHSEQTAPLLSSHAVGLDDDGRDSSGPGDGVGAHDSSCDSNGGNWTQLTTLDDSTASSRRHHYNSSFPHDTSLPPQPPQ